MSEARSSVPFRVAPLLVPACIAVFQVFVFCGTAGDYWFEDDAPHRVFVRDHPLPWAYFGPKLVSALSLGHSVTPWFPFTFWIDHQLSPLGPQAAYLHTGVSLFLTACALYLLMTRLVRPPAALACCVLWFYLPATITITEFLSTRHYLEGLLFFCLAVCAALESARHTGRRRLVWTAAACSLYLIACTTKEVYVSAGWAALVLLFGFRRRWLAVAAMVACGALYAGYRLWSLGLVGKNLGDALDGGYGTFFLRWPYMFAGHWGGYLLVGVAAVAFCVLWRRKALQLKHMVFWGALLAAMLVTILPVSRHVTSEFQALGSWYRVVFLLNSAMLVLGVWLVDRVRHRGFSVLACCLTAGCLLLGAWDARTRWDAAKQAYAADAAFYLAHQDRLLFSRLPAPWFMYGIHNLYRPGTTPHYLTWRVDRGTPEAYVLETGEAYDAVWVAGPDGYAADAALLQRVIANCREGVTPLDKARDPAGAEEHPAGAPSQ